MYDILVRAGCFIVSILIGLILRRIGFFKEEDFHVISKIVIKITLTAAIVSNFTGREMESSMFLLAVIGFLFGVIFILLGMLLNARRGRDAQSFAVLNQSGFNIGCLALPFAQGFLGPVGVMAISLFDMGNSFICLGGAYSVAALVKDKNNKFSIRFVLKRLANSLPLLTYLFMTILCALRISLPGPLVSLADMVGSANAFMAMLMIGVGFQLKGESSQLKEVLRILVTRFGVAILMALCCWFLFPFPLEYRQAMVIGCLAPVASAAPAFTADIGGDFGMASAVNSLSIVISIVLIILALLLIL